MKVSTTGDKFLNKPLAEVGGKGLFVKELERSLLNGDAHIAVHSLKDMEVHIAKDTFIGAIHSRDSRNDVLLGNIKVFQICQKMQLLVPLLQEERHF